MPRDQQEQTPDRQINPQSDTVRKTRFFEAYDNRKALGLKVAQVHANAGITKATAYRWLADRRQHGQTAYRRADLRAAHIAARGTAGPGRPYKISDQLLSNLLSRDRRINPVRNRHLEVQRKVHKVPASHRTLQRSLIERRNARIFKPATQKKITPTQALLRQTYAAEHLYDSWENVMFCDEAHYDPGEVESPGILREVGTRYEAANILTMPARRGNQVHFAAWVSYSHKSELKFYNDEYDDVQPAPRPPKPRRRPVTETEEQYKQRVAEWEAALPREPEVKKPGNSMTAKYYTDNILPWLREAYEQHQFDEIVEDSDPSHGNKNRDSLPARYRRRHGMKLRGHPPNSCDLNAIEGIFLILKARAKQLIHDCHNISEIKALLREVWSQISQDEIQSRINDLPARMGEVLNQPEKRCKSDLW